MMTPDQIFELVDIHMGGPFRWGKEDCFLGAADVFKAACGLDLAETVRGRYKTEAEAAEILSEYGGSLMIFVQCQAMRAGANLGKQGMTAPVGSLGVSPRECAIGLDGRCTSIHLGNNRWATKSARGFIMSAKAEDFWYV